MQEGLTIVVPVHNSKQLIEHTLNSIVAGTQRPQALIVVDNGSDDGTLDVCRRWQTAHSETGVEITVMVEPRAGAAIARNTGLKATRTKWVYFFDSDDDFDPDFIRDVMAGLQNHEQSGNEADIVFIPSRMEVNSTVKTRAYRHQIEPSVQILSAMLATQTMLFQTPWLREIGGWDERLTTWDDWELGVRVAQHAPKVMWMTARGYHLIHVHPDSLTGSSYSARNEAILKALQQVKVDVAHDEKALRALYLRTQIVCGTLTKEGTDDTAFRALAQELMPNRWTRGLGALLRHYTRMGGRGAWRMAVR